MPRVFPGLITRGTVSKVAGPDALELVAVVAALVCGTATMPVAIVTPINRPANSFDTRFSFYAASCWCSGNVNAN